VVIQPLRISSSVVLTGPAFQAAMSDRSADQAASAVVVDREQLTRTATSQLPAAQSDCGSPRRASMHSDARLSSLTTVWIFRTPFEG
jgi:hypothetical protein